MRQPRGRKARPPRLRRGGPAKCLPSGPARQRDYRWTKLDTEPFRGKQDDIFFLTAELGWYVNGSGKIYETTDGGATWIKKLDQP